MRKSNSKGLLICSLNVPSLLKHKDELEILMTENKIDIISIYETKLDDTIRDEQVPIEGFSLLRLDRNRHDGGVAFYIRETVNYEHRTDIKTSNVELLCIEVKQKCTKPFIVMASYRPPKYEYQTIDEIETSLKSLDAEDKEIILMGDANCNDLDIEGKEQDPGQSTQYVPNIPGKAIDQVSYSVNPIITNTH